MNLRYMNIPEIRQYLASIRYLADEALEREILEDDRLGVRALVPKIKAAWKKEREQRSDWEEMSRHERELWEAGYTSIAGLDEVGRGSLVGPVMSAAVILPPQFYLPGLRDSKQLTALERERFAEAIYKEAVAVGIGSTPVEEIERTNIVEATKKSMIAAIQALTKAPDYLLIDALKLPLSLPQRSIVRGDRMSVTIAAASVVAKVTRDRYMVQISEEYPQYGFERNKGYGTQEHLEAIARFGFSPIHRRTFQVNHKEAAEQDQSAARQPFKRMGERE